MKEKCDRKHCASKIFRGEHDCPGYDWYKPYLKFGGFGEKVVLVCPCSCHEGTSMETTMEKARADLNL